VSGEQAKQKEGGGGREMSFLDNGQGGERDSWEVIS